MIPSVMSEATLHGVLAPALGMVFAAVALFFVGTILVTTLRGRPVERAPVDFGLTKLGVSLRGDRVTLLALLSCAVALVPLAIWYQGYRAQLQDSQLALAKERERAAATEQALDRFKFYELWVNPKLPPGIDVERLRERVQIVVGRPGGAPPRLEAPREVRVGPANDLWVRVDRLNPGDELRIVIQAEQGSWTSDTLQVPRTQVEMRRQ